MKKLITLTLVGLLSFSYVAQAQKKKRGKEEIKIEVPTFTKNEKGKISYTAVVPAKGNSKELFVKGLAWMKGNYKNSTKVIKVNDPTNGKLKARPKFRIWNTSPDPTNTTKTPAGLVDYELSIDFKDGKFKYTLTNFGHKQSTFQPAEKWITENEKAYKRNYASYLVQLDKEAQRIIKTMTQAITASGEAVKEDW